MKKLFTVLFCTGLATASFAQSDRERAADVILRGGPSASYPTSSGGDCQSQIDAINRNYDAQVIAMRRNGTYSEADKAVKIRDINQARQIKINEVRRTCSGTYTNNGNGAGKKVKGNNGNHYGWEKGKGNPHGKGKGKNKDR